MKKVTRKIIILWGLPASGKSHYAKSMLNNDSKVEILDVDWLAKKKNSDLWLTISCDVPLRLRRRDVIIDGLITTNEFADKILKAITSHPEFPKDTEINIVYWNEDRESCAWNDQGRRIVNSLKSIQEMPYEEPSEELISTYHVKEVTKMNVVRKPEWAVWSEKQELGKTISSGRWCLGGSSGSCYSNGETSPVSGESPPEFYQLDDFLEKLCPNINFLQYKKLLRECVTILESGDGDYYGGYVTYAEYVCNIEKLYKFLKNLGLINE